MVRGGAFSNLGCLATSLELVKADTVGGWQGNNLWARVWQQKKEVGRQRVRSSERSPAPEGREPVWGRASPSRGIAQAGNSDRGAHGFPLHAQALVSTTLGFLTTRPQRFTCLRLSDTHLHEFSRAFPPTLTTPALVRSSGEVVCDLLLKAGLQGPTLSDGTVRPRLIRPC
jgi:hypothetical protein